MRTALVGPGVTRYEGDDFETDENTARRLIESGQAEAVERIATREGDRANGILAGEVDGDGERRKGRRR